MGRDMRRKAQTFALALVLTIPGCSGGSNVVDSPTTAPVSSLTTAVETADTTAAASTAATTTSATFTETTDLVYMTQNGAELLMDVYVPAGEGPWPVVVSFHGLDSNVKDELSTVAVAEAASTEGMLVFTPTWIVPDPPPFPMTVDTFRGFTDAANCAVAFAQQRAADLGGDATNTVVHGFSGGAGVALLAAVEPRAIAIAGCETDAFPSLVTGAVLSDGQYFLYPDIFDSAFESDLEAMQAEVAFLNDSTYWPSDLDAGFFLWAAASGTDPRTIGDPSDESGWLAKRDPDGSIRADLARLNQLEDGIISNVDNARLLHLRLTEAGLEATLDEYPGGHTTLDKLPEIVGYLKAAATK